MRHASVRKLIRRQYRIDDESTRHGKEDFGREELILRHDLIRRLSIVFMCVYEWNEGPLALKEHRVATIRKSHVDLMSGLQLPTNSTTTM